MKKYNEFIDSNEQLNEGIFDFLKKMWNKAAAHIRKIKGGKEVDAIFTKYLGIINAEIQKKANVTLQLGGEEKITKESIILRYDQFLNEEAETDMEPDVEISEEDKKKVQQSGEKDKQMDAKTLKEKEKIIEQIINLYKDKALKEMEQVLKKQGGAEKNPKLKIIIDNKIHEFNLKFLEAKVKFLEKSGDKAAMNKVAVERDKKAKELENMWKKLDEKGDVKTEGEGDFKIGNRYRCNIDGKIKTIKITSTGDETGKLKGHDIENEKDEYTIDIEKQIVKDFEIKPKTDKEEGSKFKYYSTGNKKWINVEVLSIDGDDVTVKNYEDDKSEEFKINKNTLGPRI